VGCYAVITLGGPSLSEKPNVCFAGCVLNERWVRYADAASCSLVRIGGILVCLQASTVHTQPAEPVYGGKPESYWIGLLADPGFVKIRPNLSGLGTNELTVLLKAVRMESGTNAVTIRTNAAFVLQSNDRREPVLSSECCVPLRAFYRTQELDCSEPANRRGSSLQGVSGTTAPRFAAVNVWALS